MIPARVIPVFITNALEDKPLPIYGRGKAVRDYLFVKDHCSAIDLAIHKGKSAKLTASAAPRSAT